MFLKVLFFIFAAIFLIAATTVGVTLFKIVKDPREKFNKNLFLGTLGGASVGVVSFVLMMGGVYGFIPHAPSFLEVSSALLGALLFGFALFSFAISFVIHYYRKGLNKDFDNILYIILVVSWPIMLVFFFIMSNGYADYLKYPLINGINFTEGFTTPDGLFKPTIAFYALCILSGAGFVYFLCDHKMYKQYGKHGILESTFFVAFPAGILGARLFYVIGNWHEFAGDFLKVFAIHDGGLTILGGALTGIVVGVLWFIWRNKKYSIWVAVDIILPTILIAQAVGRWGNFFNCEVHGLPVDPDLLWWMPKVVVNNAIYSSTEEFLTDGTVFLPLFYIEAVLNLLGYLILGELLPRVFKRHRELGDVALGYIVWYGLVRSILEPFRHASFNMGEDGYWSWIWSIMFILIGLVLISLNHLMRYLIKKHKGGITISKFTKENNLIASICFFAAAIEFIIPGIILMATNTFSPSLTWNAFNLGVFFLVCGGGIISLELTTIPYLLEGYLCKN